MRFAWIVSVIGALALLGCDRFGQQLPECEAPEVVELTSKILSDSPLVKINEIEFEVSVPTEVRYEKDTAKRICRAVLTSELGTEGIYYSISWQKKDEGLIWIEVYGNEDPQGG